jgi:glycosyltransferase involved in cell wall biosynthesis
MKFALFLGNAGHDSGGPEIYETELVRALAKLDQRHEFHLMCLFSSAPDVIAVNQQNFIYHVLRPNIRAISMTATLPYQLSRVAPDAVHSTFMAGPVVLQPHVLTMVCASMFDRPDFYPTAVRWRLQALTALGVRSSDLILCISEMVRDRIAERFKVSSDRMAVVPLGVDPRFRCHTQQEVRSYLDAQGIQYPYFLFCGRWEQRKNLLGTIEAFSIFKRETGLPHKLLLTGRRTWIAEKAEALIHRFKLENDVVDHGKTPIAELPFLYAGAEALVYASFYESFGIPIIEAMASGTPVITSDTTAMPETAGGAALLVDPHSPESIAAAMYKLATDQVFAATLRSIGLRRAKSFTWEATAQATLDAYHLVAAGKLKYSTFPLKTGGG